MENTLDNNLINRQAVKDIICSGVSIDTDEDKEYVCKLINKLPSVTPKEKSEYEHDHAVVKAYNDGQTYILDKIRAEIMSLTNGNTPERIWNVDVIKIIDKYGGE